MGVQTLFRLATQRFDPITGSPEGAVTRLHDGEVLRQTVADLFAHRRPGRYGAEPSLTSLHGIHAPSLCFHDPQVVSLSPAANAAGAVWTRSRDVNRTVRTSAIECPRPGAGRWPCP